MHGNERDQILVLWGQEAPVSPVTPGPAEGFFTSAQKRVPSTFVPHHSTSSLLKPQGSVSFKSLHQTPVWPHEAEWRLLFPLQFLLKPERRAFSGSVSRASCTCVWAGMGSEFARCAQWSEPRPKEGMQCPVPRV